MKSFLSIWGFILSFSFLCQSLNILALDPNLSTTKEFWKSLKTGNKRFMQDQNQASQRGKWVKGQNPKVIVIGCSDSRTPPELVFDQGIGDLFVIRVAGNVADEVDIDSIEYTLAKLKPRLIIVMGHTDCGAVDDALEHLKRNKGKIDPPNGLLNGVLISIERAILESGIDIYAPDALKKSVRVNVLYVAKQLIEKSPLIEKSIQEGRVALLGSEYSLETGKVSELFVFGEF